MKFMRFNSPRKVEAVQRGHETEAVNDSEANDNIFEHPTKTLILRQIAAAKKLAEEKANESSGDMFLSQGRSLRIYNSDWFPAYSLQDSPEAVAELQISRTEQVLRNRRGKEVGPRFRRACINLRVYDTEKEMVSHEDKNVVIFSPVTSSILIQENSEYIDVLPGDDNWDEVRGFLTTIERAE
jgi:hypothetical protein